jgi:AcrR family transcriptional regulator
VVDGGTLTERGGVAGPITADGRTPGWRGRATRQRLLSETATILREVPYRDLAVVDIARAVGTSAATFYQYFGGVEEAVLALAVDVVEEGTERLVPPVTGRPWRGRAGADAAAAVVDEFLAFYRDHRPVLRVMDLGTEEGDPRFRRVRGRLFIAFTDGLAERVAGEIEDGRHPPGAEPRSIAGAMTSMLAHVAAHQYGFEVHGIRMDDTRDAMARILFTTVTGSAPH